MPHPLNTFCEEYIDNLNLEEIKRHCKKCIYNLECREEIGDNSLTRFAECDELQDYF